MSQHFFREVSEGRWIARCRAGGGQITLEVGHDPPKSWEPVCLSMDANQARAIRGVLGLALKAMGEAEVGRLPRGATRRIDIKELWHSNDAKTWDAALDEYWRRSDAGKNAKLERELDRLSLARLRRMSPQTWYDFLRDEYFRWKYTEPRRYKTTTAQLEKWRATGRLVELDAIRKDLLNKPSDLKVALKLADSIPGLGAAGASGLLALMYPRQFGTVDQFAVKALRQLPEHANLADMNPESLSIGDAVTLIRIMRAKAEENTKRFGHAWTPRKIDMALWVCR